MEILRNAASITFDYTNLTELLAQKASSPIAETMIPDLLKDAIGRQIPVFVTSPDSDSFRLITDGANFKLVSI